MCFLPGRLQLEADRHTHNIKTRDTQVGDKDTELTEQVVCNWFALKMSELWCLGPLPVVLPGPGGLRPDALLSPAAPELPPSRGRAAGAGEGHLQPGRGTSNPPGLDLF